MSSPDLIVIELLESVVDVDILDNADITVTLPPDEVDVTVIPVGYPGPKGDRGDAAGYRHTQSQAAARWTIAHNLGYAPTVQAVSVGGVQMLASVTHLSDTVCLLDFNTPVAGTARLV